MIDDTNCLGTLYILSFCRASRSEIRYDATKRELTVSAIFNLIQQLLPMCGRDVDSLCAETCFVRLGLVIISIESMPPESNPHSQTPDYAELYTSSTTK